MLLTKSNVDCQPYNGGFRVVSWENCSLRTWLNRTFYGAAFTDAERKALVPAPVDPEKVSRFGNAADGAAGDLVTLLAQGEIDAYLGREERAATNIACAAARGAKSEEGAACPWWLRASGYEGGDAAMAGNASGEVAFVSVLEMGVALRPVIWLDLNAMMW